MQCETPIAYNYPLLDNESDRFGPRGNFYIAIYNSIVPWKLKDRLNPSEMRDRWQDWRDICDEMDQ